MVIDRRYSFRSYFVTAGAAAGLSRLCGRRRCSRSLLARRLPRQVQKDRSYLERHLSRADIRATGFAFISSIFAAQGSTRTRPPSRRAAICSTLPFPAAGRPVSVRPCASPRYPYHSVTNVDTSRLLSWPARSSMAFRNSPALPSFVLVWRVP